MRRPLNTQAGFSLLEVVVVMAIVAVLATQAGGYLSDLVTSRRFQAAADTLQAVANRARGEAIKQNRTVRLRSTGSLLEVVVQEAGKDDLVLSTTPLSGTAKTPAFTLDFDSAGRLTPFGTESKVSVAEGFSGCSEAVPCPAVQFTPLGGVKVCRTGSCS